MHNRRMNKKRKFDLLTVVVVLMMGMAVWQAYAPFITDRKKTQATMQATVRISAPEVVKKVQSSGGRPTILYTYASWCSVCAPITKMLLERIRSGALDHVQLIFMSVDESQYDIARYLKDINFNQEFTPYLYAKEPGQSLHALGTRNMRGLPYMAFFNNSGNLMREHNGPMAAFDFDQQLALTPPDAVPSGAEAAETTAE